MNPDYLIAPQQEACLRYCTAIGTPRLLPQVERTLSSSSTRNKAWLPCSDLNGTPSFSSQHERSSDTPVAPLEKARVPRLNSIGSLTCLSQLEGKAEFYAST